MEKGGRKGYITGMEEVPGKGKELSHSAHANGMKEYCHNDAYTFYVISSKLWNKIIPLTLSIPGSSHYKSSDNKHGSS